MQVLGRWQGVCRDERLRGLDSNQVFTAKREGGLTVVNYRRQLEPTEPLDRAWVVDREMYAVWAVGRLDHAAEPAFHRLFPRQDVKLHLGKNPPHQDCFAFTVSVPPRSRPTVSI